MAFREEQKDAASNCESRLTVAEVPINQRSHYNFDRFNFQNLPDFGQNSLGNDCKCSDLASFEQQVPWEAASS